MPKGKNSVMKLVHEFYEIASNQTKDEIAKLKALKLSASLDEWTGLTNRRHLNVNVHSSNGRIFEWGFNPAETFEELMLQKLTEFGLSYTDIVAATTDVHQ